MARPHFYSGYSSNSILQSSSNNRRRQYRISTYTDTVAFTANCNIAILLLRTSDRSTGVIPYYIVNVFYNSGKEISYIRIFPRFILQINLQLFRKKLIQVIGGLCAITAIWYENMSVIKLNTYN